MPTRDAAPIGAPCWIQLSTSDTDRARAFYGELFGWAAGDPVAEFGGYFNFTKDGAAVGGCMGMPDSGMPDVWGVFLATDDMAKTIEAVRSNGGTVLYDAMPVGDLGIMAVFTDPGGAVIGAWQPGTFPGITVVGEYGTPGWFELHTRDYDRVVAFYRDVFRWDARPMSDTPEFRYTIAHDGDDQLCGVMDASAFLPEGVPAHWSVYVAVEDTDAALAKTVELGGAVVMPAEDTPYGRLAAATDPTGAMFKLVAPNDAMPARD